MIVRPHCNSRVPAVCRVGSVLCVVSGVLFVQCVCELQTLPGTGVGGRAAYGARGRRRQGLP